MKKLVFISLLAFISTSCQNDMSISDEIIGEWTYKNRIFANDPEVQMTFNVRSDEGVMAFECDGRGIWDTKYLYGDNDEHSKMNWQFDDVEQNLILYKVKHPLEPSIMSPGEYKVKRIDRFNYVLVKEFSFDNSDLIVTNEIRLKRSD